MRIGAHEVLICISADSRADVDAVVEKATRAGGAPDPTPTQDFGFMYGRSFEDLDGHIWEIMWMDAEAASKACQQKKERRNELCRRFRDSRAHGQEGRLP